jgi:hypothetical protein
VINALRWRMASIARLFFDCKRWSSFDIVALTLDYDFFAADFSE